MKNDSTKDCQVINIKTGEVLSPVIEMQVAKRWLPKFVCVFARNQEDILQLPAGTISFYFQLCQAMRKGNVLLMSVRELSHSFKIPKSTVARHLMKLRKNNFIASKNSYHVINPKYVLNGGQKYFAQAMEEYDEAKCPTRWDKHLTSCGTLDN